ncbi:hypothetical protein SMU21_00790 [Streptococcus mutans 1SM1]|nr:hypothetical protein SMU21_00790 [Streptococcus mutans 1SM1]EMB70913.1 hypothetical protein SMU33_03363 [Streptococcus mutans 11SSST2]EMB73579.1 hypothetical protein SMU40_05714 [Streptococcus mutans 15VF2]
MMVGLKEAERKLKRALKSMIIGLKFQEARIRMSRLFIVQ